MPVDPATKIIKNKLEQDGKPKCNIHDNRTHHDHNGVFPEKHLLPVSKKHFEQIEGAAMGSTICPIVANLYIEDLKTRAINTAENPQEYGKGMWRTYPWYRKHVTEKISLSTLILSIHAGQFTVEETGPDCFLPFCDISVMPYPDRNLAITLCEFLILL